MKYKHKEFQGKSMIRWDDNPHGEGSEDEFHEDQSKEVKFKRVKALQR